MYGFQATPDMLAAAAVAHWKEGVVVGAARHLDNMKRRTKKLNRVGLVWFGLTGPRGSGG